VEIKVWLLILSNQGKEKEMNQNGKKTSPKPKVIQVKVRYLLKCLILLRHGIVDLHVIAGLKLPVLGNSFI